jgi:AraC-like DNA-binding protein
MSEPYIIFYIFKSGGLLACGLMFLFIAVPDKPLLANYNKARYMMAGALLFFVAVGIVEYLFQVSPPEVSDIDLMQTATLTVAASQALLFTFALLALLDIHFPGWRYIFRKAAYVLLFIAVIITSYALFSGETFRNIFYILIAIYALFLTYYTFLFIKSYRQFRLRMDNYFSDEEDGRLRWIAYSFYAALAIGIMALLSSLFMSTLVALLFSVVCNVFYIYFTVRFINYAHQFQSIERAMDDVPTPAETQCIASLPAPDNEITGMHDNTFALLEKRIGEWIDGKGFVERGITIDALSARLCTNRKYLSAYINTCKQQTFREWINALRIEEAKTLLRERPEMTVREIAARTGFATESHFGQQFRTCTGFSPSAFRRDTDTTLPHFPQNSPEN